MGDTYSTIEIRSTLRTFQEYLRDLAGAKFDQFNTKLRLFINFCEKDDTFRVIARNLHEHAHDAREWFTESAAAGKAKDLPRDAVDRLSHMYRVLLDLKTQRLDIRNFLSTLYSAPSANESLQRFSASWLEGMQDLFNKLFGAMEGELSGKERIELEGLVAGALAKMQAASAPAPAKPAAAPKAEAPAAEAKPSAKKPAKAAKAAKEPPIDALLKDLEKAVKGAKGVATQLREDIATDVKILKLELSKSAPNLDVVKLVAGPLERAGGKIAELGARIAAKARPGK